MWRLDKVDKGLVWNLGLFYAFLCGIFHAYLVVFSLYLALTKEKIKKREIEEEEKNIIILIKVHKGKGMGGGQGR